MEDFGEYCDGEYDDHYDHAEYLRELHGGDDNNDYEHDPKEYPDLAPTALPWMTVEQVAEYVRGDNEVGLDEATRALRVALADGILRGFVPPAALTVPLVKPAPLPAWEMAWNSDEIPF